MVILTKCNSTTDHSQYAIEWNYIKEVEKTLVLNHISTIILYPSTFTIFFERLSIIYYKSTQQNEAKLKYTECTKRGGRKNKRGGSTTGWTLHPYPNPIQKVKNWHLNAWETNSNLFKGIMERGKILQNALKWYLLRLSKW